MILDKSRTFNYLSANKKNLLIILCIVFLADFFSDPSFITNNLIFDTLTLILGTILTVMIFGYGLEVTRDVTYEGQHLPDLKMKRDFILGIKFLIANAVFLVVQFALLSILSKLLHFPDFELEGLVLNIGEVLGLFYSHNPVYAILFIILGIALTYITVFFFEIGLARLADSGSLRDCFNLMEIKSTIDKIGWKYYAIDYTKIISSILVLTYINILVHKVYPNDYILQLILNFLMFMIQFLGIGFVYRIIKTNENDNGNDEDIK